MIKFHLLSNAHIDPVWQWRRDEGVGVAISTFSAAADFCEEYDNYVFCHNEAILYQWIEKFSPKLFARIKKLVHQKKWKIMGAWYLQPDCNMPSGEATIRQIKEGVDYFTEKFGEDFVMPKTVVNFDCPGASPGLLQIINDFGYENLIYIRGEKQPDKTRGFIFKAKNGQVYAYRCLEGYCSHRGNLSKELEYYIDEYGKDYNLILCPWGVGNHGGGPSRVDIESVEVLKEKFKDVEFIHSEPDAFFEDLKKLDNIKTFTDLGTANEGTYSAEYEVKKLYNRLENTYFAVEKMATYCMLLGMEYPFDALKRAELDMIEVQFHDSVTGTSIREVEDDLFSTLRHGLEELERVKTECLYYLMKGEDRAKSGEYPVFLYNPHPYKVSTAVDCEIMLDGQGWDIENRLYPVLFDGDKEIPVQTVRESSTVPLDWRKRISFNAEVEPFSLKRYSCYFKQDNSLKPRVNELSDDDYVYLSWKNCRVKISKYSGLIDEFSVNGINYLAKDSAKLVLLENTCDPWGFEFNSYKKQTGEFRVMTAEEGADFLRIEKENFKPVRIIEDGEIKTVVESYFIYGFSRARVTYTVYKNDDILDVNVDLYNAEKDCKLKFKLNTPFANAEFEGKTMFSRYNLDKNGNEVVAQDYVTLNENNKTIALYNFGTYGFDFNGGSLGVTLLTGCGYSAEPIEDRQILPNDRFSYRFDQGERNFRFVIKCGATDVVDGGLEIINQVLRQPLIPMNFFPVGEEKNEWVKVNVSNPSVTMECFKAEKDGSITVRLYNSVDVEQETELVVGDYAIKTCLGGYQFKSFKVDKYGIKEVDVLGRVK